MLFTVEPKRRERTPPRPRDPTTRRSPSRSVSRTAETALFSIRMPVTVTPQRSRATSTDRAMVQFSVDLGELARLGRAGVGRSARIRPAVYGHQFDVVAVGFVACPDNGEVRCGGAVDTDDDPVELATTGHLAYLATGHGLWCTRCRGVLPSQKAEVPW